MWKRCSILCGALALTWAAVMFDGPGYITGRGRTCIGTVSGADMNGPSEYRGLIPYAERTDVYENLRVVGSIWTVHTLGLAGTAVLIIAVWVLAARLAQSERTG